MRTALIFVGVIGCLLAAGKYGYEYYLDHYAYEFRIESDVPGTAVYLNGKRLGVTPVRIFSEEFARVRVLPGRVEKDYLLRDFLDGRGMELSTTKYGPVRLEFEPPRSRPGEVRIYAKSEGERAIVREAGVYSDKNKHVARFKLIPRPKQPELWIECDVPQAIIRVNGRSIGQPTPIRLHGKANATYSTEIVPGGEGVELFGHYATKLKFECRVPSALAKEFECYERDQNLWLKLGSAELTSAPGDKVTLYLRAKAR